MNTILVTGATLLQNFKINIEFSDLSCKVIDFEQFLKENSHPQWDKYRNKTHFKKFRIENGNLIWGRNWDLIFPVYSLYTGNLYEQCC